MMRPLSNSNHTRALLGNPLTRTLLSSLCRECEVDGRPRLEVALDLCTGQSSEGCLYCRMASKGIDGLLTAGGLGFGIDRANIMVALRDPYWRRGLINVLKGIAVFGVRRPFVPGAPFQVVWDVTYSCNLRCQHCYASAGKPRPDELTTVQAFHLIDKLAAWGVPIIAFSGGEPLMRPDILELTRYASERGIYVALATNGTLITPAKAQEMKEAGVGYLQISLDGATPVTHDRFRGIEGAFERTVEGLINAVDQGFFTSISTTATRRNLGEIPDIIDLGDRLGVDWVMIYNFIPAGRGREHLDVDLDPEQREGLLRMLYDANERTRCKVLTTAPQYARVALTSCRGESFMVPTHFYNLNVDKKLLSLTDFIGGCGAGRFYVAIRGNGDMDPCVFFPRTVGNAYSDDLPDLWKNEQLLAALRDKDHLKGNCGQCGFRYQCGGCRARAYGYLGDPLAPDPGCIRNSDLHEVLLTGRER